MGCNGGTLWQCLFSFFRQGARRGYPAATGEGIEPATITSDASGSWGGGAFNSQGEWFQFRWPDLWAPFHITEKELLPIVISMAMWGRRWQGEWVRCRCDNAAVVATIRSGCSKDVLAMHLMRSSFFFLAAYDIRLWTVHVPGVQNNAADALS